MNVLRETGSRRSPRMDEVFADVEGAVVFRDVARARWFLTRRLHDIGLELVWVGTNELIRARRGRPTARITGLPGELLLFFFGRRDAAQVGITGPPAAVAAVRRTPFGI